MDRHYDVIVAGARCAGAATAMLLARDGARVLVVDRAPEGSDTISTHALMRGGVLLLARWGLLDEVRATGAPPLRVTTFHYGGESVAVPIKPRDGIDALWAPRRTVLDPILVRAARRAGADVRHRVTVRGVLHGPAGSVRGVALEQDGVVREVEAGIVIGADGVRSTIAREAGAATTREAAHSTAVVYGYWPGLKLDGTHWYYEPGVAAGVFPTDGDLTCVFVAVPPARFESELRSDLQAGFIRVLGEAAPELAHVLAVTPRAGALRPFAGRTGFFRRAQGPGWALVGDAGYFKDPITAHGITDALRDASALARAVAAGTASALAAYEEERDDASRDLFAVTDRIASFAWDLEEVQRLHRDLSEAMKREVAALAEAPADTSLGGVRTAHDALVTTRRFACAQS